MTITVGTSPMGTPLTTDPPAPCRCLVATARHRRRSDFRSMRTSAVRGGAGRSRGTIEAEEARWVSPQHQGGVSRDAAAQGEESASNVAMPSERAKNAEIAQTAVVGGRRSQATGEEHRTAIAANGPGLGAALATTLLGTGLLAVGSGMITTVIVFRPILGQMAITLKEMEIAMKVCLLCPSRDLV